MISYKLKKGMSLDNLESCPNDEKRVEQINDLRYNLDGVLMIGNKRDEELIQIEPSMLSKQ